VLVVEDDLLTRRFYAAALTTAGFRIEDAHNGFQALEKALEASPDLILTDIVIPGLDGIELCRQLRTDLRTHRIPVLAITGYGDRDYEQRVLAAGANRMLAKPCTADALVAAAQALLTSCTSRAV
jgi:DNA-binding response OmpR family regulator